MSRMQEDPSNAAGAHGAARRSHGVLASHRSVRNKLLGIVLLTTAFALLVSDAAMLLHDLTVYRDSSASGLRTQASILALSTAPALAFDDRAIAARNLAALQARSDVVAAAIYTRSGAIYSQFARDPEIAPPEHIGAWSPGVHIGGDRIEIVHRIVQNGEWLGTIYLHAQYDLAKRIATSLGIFAVAALLSMGAALILSARLQRAITGPLEEIATIARRLSRERDYSLRATRTTDDEIGVVVEAFNGMLDEVQARTRALEETNASLRTSERLYRAIGESIDYGVWICDAEGRNLYSSESFLKLTGLTQEQCSNLGWTHILHPDEAEATREAWQHCVRTGTPWYCEHRYLGTDGQYHPVVAHGTAIRAEDGRITGWAGINLDISRLKRTEEALREADRRKDEFLATLAHELRNPLAPIRHATKILDLPAASEDQRRWAREVISRQVQHMALLLEDLLDVSRITRGRLELKKDYVSLDKLVAAAVETAAPLIDAKQHSLEVRLPQEPIGLHVDPLRMAQALSNLLTNAAKYTDPHGHIIVSVTLTPDGIDIYVEDTGIGLAESALSKVFEMFSQVESAMERSQGGLGIGLALVKGLVSLHGGSVSAQSAGIGHGSRFTLHLPSSCIVHEAMRAPSEASADTLPGDPAFGVLIADDNKDAADSLAILLQIAGYQVHLAHSGAEALQNAERERPAALILDIGMPDQTGYEVARQLRRAAWAKQSLFVAVTGWGQAEDKQQAHAAGFDYHLTKPVDVRELENLLLRHREQRDAKLSMLAEARKEMNRAAVTPLQPD
jgi:PAS domain S-box-containing protein